MVVVERVRQRDVQAVVVCSTSAVYVFGAVWDERAKLTVCDALEVVVGLGRLQVGADEFKVDLVEDVAEQDEGRHDALASARPQRRRDAPVQHVARRGEQGADAVLRHREQERVLERHWLSARHPIGL